MSDKDRIAALEREVAELKGKVDPPQVHLRANDG